MMRVVSNIASVISRSRFGILAMAAMAFAAETANDVPGAAAPSDNASTTASQCSEACEM